MASSGALQLAATAWCKDRTRFKEMDDDAMRYRWLRDIGDSTWTPMAKRPGVNFTHEIDNAIDAAIAKAGA